MSEDTDSVDAEHDEAGHDDHGHGTDHSDEAHAGRVTSPMQDFEMNQVTFGAVVMLVGVIVTIGLPVLLG
ncbi:DUF7550 family protein [Haloarchaeobius iranensis]|uniref:Uncharacterized protein n=1 Tax=Haloarchaeobius iranensis TaxID=996166 RepID=A0A1G9T6Z1_9EURY|nr:hypothetical protein [Haloarchaeobius iranensis]SDM43392.1 hypothetical protein SAMN05192554_102170 [Haloarchaeobius iranensis]